MKSTDDRGLFATLIASAASSGNVSAIPSTQTTAGNGEASIALGFPPETFIARSAGGVPPNGADMNGFLNLFSRALRAVQTGFFGQFDSGFAQSIGGYPSGAVVAGSAVGTFWVSTSDDNVTTPGVSGAAWASLVQSGRRNIISFTQSQNWIIPAGVTNIFAKFWGAGGAGGLGVNNGAGAGGNGGQYVEVSLAVSPGQSLWVGVGAGGVPSSVSGEAGTVGGDSTVAGIAARGGTQGGEGSGTYGQSNSNRPAAGVANGIALAGGGGTNAILFKMGDYSTYQAGIGGGSPCGGSIAFSGVAGSAGSVDGSSGSYPGGGGGGGINATGGYGANGLVLIEY